MNLAIKEAWKYQGLTYPNPTVGAVVLDKNFKILSISAHHKAGESHAEVLAIKEAYIKISNDEVIENISKSEEIHKYLIKNHNNIFKDFTIFVTLEPCNHYGKTPPCSLLIQKLGFKKVIIGLQDTNQQATGGANFLKNKGVQIEFCTDLNTKENLKNLIFPFKKNNFLLFKMAQTLNGNLTDGIISSLESRKLTHKIRDKIDLLVIGGETVRKDRPTLDSRLINGKPPNIFIYSKSKIFDKSIPLFKVPNRKVIISDDLSIIKNYNFIMVEGGKNLFQIFYNKIDFLLIFMSSTINNFENYHLQNRAKFKIIHQDKIDNDLIIWLKNYK
jgi:diaminohydroxyphosphoribosylaminopyrimidine deaminase/5-amino-6-(5-phosphoribosylamino)uracil reductase